MIPDIHVLTMPRRKDWLRQCVGSLDGQPCNVHIIEQPSDFSAVNRKLGFSSGTSQFVGFADDDDIVEPMAVQRLIDALESNPDAVGAYTDEILVDSNNRFIQNGKSTGKDWSLLRHLGCLTFVHHIWIARRESVERYIDETLGLVVAGGWALTALMSIDGPWIHVPHVGYRWRQHNNSHHNRMHEHSDTIALTAKHIARRWVESGIIDVQDVPVLLRP